MTEKRFILDDDGIVTDMVDLSMYIDNEDCCEKLNELYDENEQLKSENEELKKRDNLVLGYLTDEGIITFEKYNEIVDYLYKKWQKRNGDVE